LVIARLVEVRVEDEAPFFAGLVIVAGEAPSGNDARKRGDVLLRVAAIDAERVQLQNLPGEILVEPLLLALSAPRIRPHRLLVVEIDEHGRMLLGSKQHVFEAPEYMRTDDLALIGARENAIGAGLARRDAEMVRPEQNEALAETGKRCFCGFKPCQGFGLEHLAHSPAQRPLRPGPHSVL